MQIHQITPALLYGDALGNQVRALREVFQSWGYRSEVYTDHADPRLPYHGYPSSELHAEPDDVIIFHYAVGSVLTEWVKDLPCRVLIYYHNITPIRLARGSDQWMRERLHQGRAELLWFKDRPLTLAASEYNRRELCDLGFQNVHVVPYLIDFEQMRASAESPAGQRIVSRYRSDGWVNWLYVGRIVENKKQDDLIAAFNYYHRLINPHSRLLLVGHSLNNDFYRADLEVSIAMWSLRSVELCGHVGLHEGLGGYYRSADVFVSMSEHEGFGIPMIEAMDFDVPVLAYKSSGVPFALNGAGVLFTEKRFDVVAELVHVVLSDDQLRARVIERQRQRVAELQHDQIINDLQQVFASQLSRG